MRIVVRVLLLAILATLPGLGLAEVANRHVVADPRTEIVEATGYRATQGADPMQRFMEMTENHAWLYNERAPLAPTAGIAIDLTDEDRVNIGERPCEDCDGRLLLNPYKLRVGVVKQVEPVRFRSLAPQTVSRSMSFERGALRRTDDGFVWTLAVESLEARALRVLFNEFDLPGNAEVWIYNDHGEAYGPFNGQGLHGDGEFWAPSVSGNMAYVQLHYFGELDRDALEAIRFEIPQVAHLGSRALNPIAGGGDESIGTNSFCNFNESCVENANCSNMPGGVAQARDGVAHMQWISGPYINICTGGLLADTAGSGAPLFLTANHCLRRGKDARNLETFWQFETGCGGSCPQPYQDPPGVTKLSAGANILRTSSTGDFTLMELKEPAPGTAFHMGWTNQAVANSNGAQLYRVHHPSGAPQAYTEHEVDTSAGQCQGVPRGNWIYSRDTFGATEGGSSGSLVMNGSGQVVGQLTGACGTNTGNVCASQSNATIDGALAAYYSNVAEWLDPATGGCGDGTCGPGEDSCNCAADCGGPPAEQCTDGSDNDCDGAVDCSDTDCANDPACDGGGCSSSGESCSSNSECCSNKCKGPPSGRTCR